jgi:hypothetical protein
LQREVELRTSVAGDHLVQAGAGVALNVGKRATELIGEIRQPVLESNRSPELLTDETRHLVLGAEQVGFLPLERECGPSLDESFERLDLRARRDRLDEGLTKLRYRRGLATHDRSPLGIRTYEVALLVSAGSPGVAGRDDVAEPNGAPTVALWREPGDTDREQQRVVVPYEDVVQGGRDSPVRADWTRPDDLAPQTFWASARDPLVEQTDLGSSRRVRQEHNLGRRIRDVR